VPTNPSKIPRIEGQKLKAKIDAGEKFLLIDTRFKEEYDYSRIPGAVLAELGSFTSGKWKPEGSLDQEIILYCG
jgi:sulfur-carrier protein adenylyltransferase/sulfurtransferase